MDLYIKDVESVLTSMNCKLIAGQKGIENKVTGINVIESQNIFKYLEGGEILITSLYPHIFMPYSYIEFFKLLYKKNIAAVMIKIGNYVNKVPDEIIEFCNQVGLPIIQLPKETYFSNIIYKVMLMLCNHDNIKMQVHLMTNEKLMKIMSVGEQCINKMMDFLSEFLKKKSNFDFL